MYPVCIRYELLLVVNKRRDKILKKIKKIQLQNYMWTVHSFSLFSTCLSFLLSFPLRVLFLRHPFPRMPPPSSASSFYSSLSVPVHSSTWAPATDPSTVRQRCCRPRRSRTPTPPHLKPHLRLSQATSAPARIAGFRSSAVSVRNRC
jgi:hypothetical protein